jgi:antitoxin VapB
VFGNAVILEPVAHNWAWVDEVAGPLHDDFVRAATERPSGQDRAALDYFE